MSPVSDNRISRRKRYARHRILILGLLAATLLAVTIPFLLPRHPRFSPKELSDTPVPEWITQDFIRVGGSSRRGIGLNAFNDVVVHYVGNPGTTAKQNRDWFDNPQSQVSAHFVVGLDGEIIQCLPLGELSSASNHRNPDTISIEVCHPDDSGKFNDVTYNSLIKLTAWLLDVGKLDNDCVIRHHDVTGKECPRYFVRHPESWDQFRADVTAYRQQ